MTYTKLRAALNKIHNLSEFSRRSGVPLRTLFRLRRSDAPPPLPRTVQAIESALAETVTPRRRADDRKRGRVA